MRNDEIVKKPPILFLPTFSKMCSVHQEKLNLSADYSLAKFFFFSEVEYFQEVGIEPNLL